MPAGEARVSDADLLVSFQLRAKHTCPKVTHRK